MVNRIHLRVDGAVLWSNYRESKLVPMDAGSQPRLGGPLDRRVGEISIDIRPSGNVTFPDCLLKGREQLLGVTGTESEHPFSSATGPGIQSAVPRSLHLKLIRLAKAENVSLNQFITAVLAEAAGEKAAKSKEVLLAIREIDPWSMGSWIDQGEWQTRLHSTTDHEKLISSIHSLLNKTPTKELNPFGREFKSDDEEPHEIWNEKFAEIAHR